MKKEKPLIQHPTDPLSTQAELPVPQPLFDDRSMNLSEKEIIDLFEKMMVSFVFHFICFPYILLSVAQQFYHSFHRIINNEPSVMKAWIDSLICAKRLINKQSCHHECWRRWVWQGRKLSLKSIFILILLPTDLHASLFYCWLDFYLFIYFLWTKLCQT